MSSEFGLQTVLYFQALYGSNVCEPCPKFTYQPKSGSIECLTCPEDYPQKANSVKDDVLDSCNDNEPENTKYDKLVRDSLSVCVDERNQKAR